MIIEHGQEDFWRKRLAEMARLGAAIGDCGKMCSTCAFKLDSEANLEPWNIEAAVNMIMTDGIFGCHIKAGTPTGTTCAGFRYAKQYITKIKDDEDKSNIPPATVGNVGCNATENGGNEILVHETQGPAFDPF